LLRPDRINLDLKAKKKPEALRELVQMIRQGDDSELLLATLTKREELGSTGIGKGIAIPHGKVPTLNRVYGLFARLATPIDFESVDGQPVDLVFVLLAPDHAGADHLKALAKISRLLRDPVMVQKLRGTESAESLYAILTEPAATASSATAA